ncbi:hypothetical protein ABID14_000712 [Peptoniphilus olsenii]|uniref:DUF3592 domain-containing protein n=1 Tax=Peptoniphilus olsenii TaxID=411570 RepID=A0ABV2J8H3_9FIRM
MNFDLNSFLINFGVAIIFIWGVYYFILRKNPKYRKSLRKECSAKTVGEILEYKDPKFGKETIKVLYFVDGKKYIIKDEVTRKKTDVKRVGMVPVSFTEKTGIKDLKQGSKVDIYYKPSDPNISYIAGNLGE